MVQWTSLHHISHASLATGINPEDLGVTLPSSAIIGRRNLQDRELALPEGYQLTKIEGELMSRRKTWYPRLEDPDFRQGMNGVGKAVDQLVCTQLNVVGRSVSSILHPHI